MPPHTYIHLVRHAQGYHNLSAANHQIQDPDLTPLGEQQCAALCAGFPLHEKVTQLVASPMRRTINTCLLSFAPVVARGGLPVVLLPELQEVSNYPCDTGSHPDKLVEEFGDKVDVGRVRAAAWDWTDKTSDESPWQPRMGKVEARAVVARRWLREVGAAAVKESTKEGGDVHIVVVTHGGFLHFLTEDWDGMNPKQGTGWDNAECRTYEFKDPEGESDEKASLVETKASWRRRRGSTKGLTETEQMELRVALKGKLVELFGGDVEE
ncbi:histidine phosphatase superfamily [Bombardia bombarda]|uniref:Histidine phosphatase superfamily n=1 Tax=Bombardia bombarda TaxID=252184 RepID=A0AA39X874_9PEZI|nr:histidine phosphatase superfamily [Bombardia bombarda]